jgi:RimJ/RimL family protein N-acetyltransferase
MTNTKDSINNLMKNLFIFCMKNLSVTQTGIIVLPVILKDINYQTKTYFMDFLFESSRLYFREFDENDIQLLYELNSNPNVIKYVHEPAPTIENITLILHNNILPQYALYGMGRWTVHIKSNNELKSNNEFIGWCGLKYIKETDEVDLGYRFKENYWGKGYGFEAAKATLDYGFNNLQLKKITATVLPENIASRKIMEKCGMQFMGEVTDKDNWLVKKYELSMLSEHP